METTTKKVTKKCSTKQLQKGSKLSRISYMEVVKSGPQSVQVKNEEGLVWDIGPDIVEKECFSAHQFNEEVKVSRTELIEIFSRTGDAVYTVNFNKQPKVEEVFDEIANTGKLISNKDMKKKLKDGMKGEERTLIGYTIRVENGFGRSQVIDMEIQRDASDKPDWDSRQRQVDHRTLNWLVVKNVKYVVK